MRTSVRVYRALLSVYPPDHRLAYGDPMIQLFSDRLRRDGGGFGTVEVWTHTLFDLVVSASKERMETMMTNDTRLGGWKTAALALLAAHSFVAGFEMAASGHPNYAFGLGFVPGAVLIAGVFYRSRPVSVLVVLGALVAAGSWLVASYWMPFDWWMLYPIAFAIPVIITALTGRTPSDSSGATASA